MAEVKTNFEEEEEEKILDCKYRQLFGYVSGYLPRNRQAVDDFQERVVNLVKKQQKEGKLQEWHESIAKMAALIGDNGIVRMYVTRMIREVPPKHRKIESIEMMLHALNQIIGEAPLWNADPDLRNAFPISKLFCYAMMTPSGFAAFRNDHWNNSILGVLEHWCNFLDSEDSQYVLNRTPTGWLSPSAWKQMRLDEFIIPNPKEPHGGFKSYNEYFHRQIKAECRPIEPVENPQDPKVIISANDGTVFKIERNVKKEDEFWMKGQPYSLVNMLDRQKFTRHFIGGDVFQSFLSGANYHRFHAPVSGVIKYCKIVTGLTYSSTETAGCDPTAGTYSQSYQSSVNVRAIILIKADYEPIGRVVVLPVGITEVSSIRFSVSEEDHVDKGDELGYFSYGGSTLCLVFQPGVVKKFLKEPPPPDSKDPDDGPKINVNAAIALVN